MRVIVTGSRGWTDRGRITDRLALLNPEGCVIVVGYDPERDRPRGVDRIAYQEAQKLGLLVEPHPANWDLHGKAAGFIRNEDMAALGADLCIAFWDGRSTGTYDMMTRAKSRGITVEVVPNLQNSWS
jgi:YspA, cpYpsA-related SLOG family